ncbi:MAG: condensation domain-containing protein [Bacteroidota bacterium]
MGETIRRAGEKDHYEVSHAQKRLWIAAQTDRNDTSYNIFGAYGMEGDLDVSVLEKSLTAFIRRHEITRTNIITVNGEPRQIIRDWESRAFKVEVVDIECEAEIGKYCQIEFEQQFNLEKDLLLKAKLLRSNSRKHFLLFTMHHIISDAWSLTILAKEVITLYESFKNNVPMLPLQPLAIQYKDYAEWHNAQLRNGALQTHREYWSRRFKDKIPSMDFPTDFERPAERTLNGDSVYGKIDQPLFGELKLQSTRYETSIFTMMIAAVSSLFYRYTGQGDIVFKTPVSGRTEKAMEDQIGFYINTLPLYTRIREGMTFTELLAEVKRETVESFTHQTYPIDDLIEYFKIKKIDGRSPLSDIVILYLNSSSHSDPLDKMVDVKISEVDLNTRINKFDLRIVFGETPEALNVKIDYNIDLYKKATIELLLSRLTRIVEVFTRNPIERIDQIEFTIDNSRQTIVEQGEYAQAFSGFNFN